MSPALQTDTITCNIILVHGFLKQLYPRRYQKHTLPETNKSHLKMDDSKRSFPFGAISAYFQVRNVSSWRVTTCTLDGQNPKQPHGMYKTLLKMGYTTISTVNFRECSSCLITVSISNLDSPPLVVSDLKISALDRLLTSLRGRREKREKPRPSVTWCSDANPGVWACGRFAG